jgi:hypothetical protein
VSIDAGPQQRIDVNAKLRIGSLRSGTHHVQLASLAANCSVDETTGHWVDVVGDAAVSSVSFSVSCADINSGCPGCWDY